MSYAEIEKRVNLSMEHFKKPCLNGDCEQDGDRVIHCERHADTSAVVRRYIRMEEFRFSQVRYNPEDDCLDLENCGRTLEGHLVTRHYLCDNCREDRDYFLECKRDEFNR